MYIEKKIHDKLYKLLDLLNKEIIKYNLEYMIDKLGPAGLTEFSEIQEQYVKDQTLVFLIREFKDTECCITRVFTEEDKAQEFKDKMDKMLTAAGSPFNTQHEVAEINYDEFAELESREGVKQYFWYNE